MDVIGGEIEEPVAAKPSFHRCHRRGPLSHPAGQAQPPAAQHGEGIEDGAVANQAEQRVDLPGAINVALPGGLLVNPSNHAARGRFPRYGIP
jgi:hypothetical protein